MDTVLKFVGQGEGSNEKNTSTPSKTLEIMRHVERFLAPTHQILVDLKLRFISQIEKQVSSNLFSISLKDRLNNITTYLCRFSFFIDIRSKMIIITTQSFLKVCLEKQDTS